MGRKSRQVILGIIMVLAFLLIVPMLICIGVFIVRSFICLIPELWKGMIDYVFNSGNVLC